MVKLVTLNCFLAPWSMTRAARLPLIVSALRKENPDVIFLQEVFSALEAEFLKRQFRIRGYRDVYHAKDLFVASKTPFLSRACFEFSQQGPLLSWAFIDCMFRKAYQVVRIKHKNEEWLLGNVHLLSAYGHDEGTYRQVRNEQVKELCSYLQDQRADKIIIAGDFNFNAGSSTYHLLLGQFDFHDPLAGTKESTISTANLNRQSIFNRAMEQRIDHFFLKGFAGHHAEGRVIFQQMLKSGERYYHISDHYGLSLAIDA